MSEKVIISLKLLNIMNFFFKKNKMNFNRLATEIKENNHKEHEVKFKRSNSNFIRNIGNSTQTVEKSLKKYES